MNTRVFFLPSVQLSFRNLSLNFTCGLKQSNLTVLQSKMLVIAWPFGDFPFISH